MKSEAIFYIGKYIYWRLKVPISTKRKGRTIVILCIPERERERDLRNLDVFSPWFCVCYLNFSTYNADFVTAY